MEIKLTNAESEEYFYNALCNGLNYFSGYGIILEYDTKEYQKSRTKLKSPCFEDVLMQMLRDGKTLTFEDIECEGEYTRTISLKDIHDKVSKTPIKHLSDMINENDDATTADVILQSVLYDEIIFG